MMASSAALPKIVVDTRYESDRSELNTRRRPPSAIGPSSLPRPFIGPAYTVRLLRRRVPGGTWTPYVPLGLGRNTAASRNGTSAIRGVRSVTPERITPKRQTHDDPFRPRSKNNDETTTCDRAIHETVNAAVSAGGSAARCDILFLDLGPIFLDVLGLVVDQDPAR